MSRLTDISLRMCLWCCRSCCSRRAAARSRGCPGCSAWPTGGPTEFCLPGAKESGPLQSLDLRKNSLGQAGEKCPRSHSPPFPPTPRYLGAAGGLAKRFEAAVPCSIQVGVTELIMAWTIFKPCASCALRVQAAAYCP